MEEDLEWVYIIKTQSNFSLRYLAMKNCVKIKDAIQFPSLLLTTSVLKLNLDLIALY